MQTITQNLNAETVEGRVVYLPAGARVVPVDPEEISFWFLPPPGAGHFCTLADWMLGVNPAVAALVIPLAYIGGEVDP